VRLNSLRLMQKSCRTSVAERKWGAYIAVLRAYPWCDEHRDCDNEHPSERQSNWLLKPSPTPRLPTSPFRFPLAPTPPSYFTYSPQPKFSIYPPYNRSGGPLTLPVHHVFRSSYRSHSTCTYSIITRFLVTPDCVKLHPFSGSTVHRNRRFNSGKSPFHVLPNNQTHNPYLTTTDDPALTITFHYRPYTLIHTSISNSVHLCRGASPVAAHLPLKETQAIQRDLGKGRGDHPSISFLADRWRRRRQVIPRPLSARPHPIIPLSPPRNLL